MADEFRQLAKESRQCGAGIRAVAELGILTGHRIEKSEIGAPGEFDAMSDAQLEAAVRERLVALGWLPGPAISNGSIALTGAATDPKDRDD